MNTILLVIMLILIIFCAVIAYNLYQEQQYRKSIRQQFGHADQDALMTATHKSVRDGRVSGQEEEPQPLLRRAPVKPVQAAKNMPEPTPAQPILEENTPSEPIFVAIEEDSSPFPIATEIPENDDDEQKETIILEEPIAPLPEIIPPAVEIRESTEEIPPQKTNFVFNEIVPQKLLIELDDLAQNDLIWFDKRFDFLGYIALSEPRELTALPRLSSSNRFQIIGCTMDGRFQIAEPIPGVLYQAFVIGLQGISRDGLVSRKELEYFSHQIQLFASKMGGQARVADIPTFLQIAEPLDQLCSRVDIVLEIYVVSRGNVSGIELQNTLRHAGFTLSEDGEFQSLFDNGEVKYRIKTLDNKPFTDALLASQRYKGFVMLFDITRIPDGEHDFNDFINLAVKLSSTLNFDLVDDQMRPLSIEWLKNIRSYVGERQAEMQQVGIEPASTLAKRLFS